MKVVTAHMEDKKVKLREVEFNGTILELCQLLNLDKYTDAQEDVPSDLIISKSYSYVMSDEYILPSPAYQINGVNHREGYTVVFIGIENIVENKPLLTMEYLESTIKYPTENNPDME
jgi:hypothetical protein